MHFCCLVITKEFPTNDILEEILMPYDEAYLSEGQHPAFTWDWWVVGGRFGGCLKLKIDNDNEEYNWRFYAKEPRAGRLFRCSLLERNPNVFPYHMEDDWYHYMGMRDNFLYVDGAKVDDLLDFDKTQCYAFIDKDGEACAREYWDGKNFTDVADFDDRLASVLAGSAGCYACIVDMHD